MHFQWSAVVILLTAVLSSTVQTQTRPAAEGKLPRPAVYDTPEQTQAAKYALAVWSLANSSKENPASSRNEYAVKVLEILKRIPPHKITYAMYRDLNVEDQNGNFLADAWLNFGSLPEELSRTSLGGVETVIYQWKNSNGSNVIGTFQNGHLVSKAQTGLQ
jgi:hypothetical protein